MPNPALSITQMNDAVFATFQRATGSVDAFVFAPWWAAREREVIAMQCEGHPELAASRWARLSRGEQQARFLLYIEELAQVAQALRAA